MSASILAAPAPEKRVVNASRPLLGWIQRIAVVLGVLLLLLWLVGPILWIGIASVQPESAITVAPPQLTWHLNWHWYGYLLTTPAWIHATWVSLQVSVLVTLFSIVIGGLAAYPLARLDVPGRTGIMGMLIGTQMMPAIVIAIPILLMFRFVHLTDTVTGLVLVNTAFTVPLVVWLLYNFFEEVPKALESAARIDGCSRLGALFRITIPAASPGISATAILILIGTWNEFLFAVILGDRNAVTVTRRIAFLQSLPGAAGQPPYSELAAAGILAVAPCILLVLLFHRKIIAGITEGFIKG
jgi:ABC-type glycerol-3-phosphate transport system permease component